MAGFVPLVIAKACQDNLDPCEVHFIDPSLVDNFWKDPVATEARFRSFGLDNVRHHLHTTRQFGTGLTVLRKVGGAHDEVLSTEPRRRR